MGVEQWLSAAAGVLFLALGVLAGVRGARSPLAPPLSFLGLAVFAYETLKLVRGLSADPVWGHLDRASASLVGPPTLWLVATFVGRARSLRTPLIVATLYFSALSLACVVAAAMPSVGPRIETWAVAMLVGMVPTFGAIPFVLAHHSWVSGTEERARTQLFGLALLLGVGGVTCELLALAGAPAPRLGAIGLAISALLLGALVPRVRIIEGLTGFTVVSAVALASVAVLGHAMIVAWFGDRTMLVVFGTALLTLSLLAALRPLQIHLTEERARARHLSTLGRFSAQMAHDLKNPLAAIKGAAQFLAEESASGRSIDDHSAFVDLILDQSDRLARVVETYQRLGRVEAVRAPVDLARVVGDVVSAQQAAARGEGIEVSADVRGTLGDLLLDGDLVAGALENLVKNAREAFGGRPGHITVVLELRGNDVSLRVADDGPGMDVRTRERAFDEFYTTKASGSGLGLAFVARVAHAHAGQAAIRDDVAKGTVVEMSFPRVPSAQGA